jgi:hypothetical protein
MRGLGAVSTEPGTSDVEDIICPDTYQVGADAQGHIWCENATGGRLPPTYRPSTKLVKEPMGVLGWSMIIAGTLMVGYLVVGKQHAAPNARARRRIRPNGAGHVFRPGDGATYRPAGARYGFFTAGRSRRYDPSF